MKLFLCALAALLMPLAACMADDIEDPSTGPGDVIIVEPDELPDECEEEAAAEDGTCDQGAVPLVTERVGLSEPEYQEVSPQGSCPSGYHPHYTTWSSTGLFSGCNAKTASFGWGTPVCMRDGWTGWWCDGYFHVWVKVYPWGIGGWHYDGWMKAQALSGH